MVETASVVTPFVRVGTYRQEFRYLRTVMITARRLPGLGFAASLALTAPRDLPAPGRRQTLYVVLRLQQVCVLVNSRLDLFAAAGPGSRACPHPGRRPFSKVAGRFCQFLDHSFSRSPWYSLPTHLCRFAVRGVGLSRVSRQHGLTGFRHVASSGASGSRGSRVSLGTALRLIAGTSRTPVQLPSCVAPSVIAPFRGGAGMSARCASATPSGLALAPTDPGRD